MAYKVGDQFVITIDSKMSNHHGNLYTLDKQVLQEIIEEMKNE